MCFFAMEWLVLLLRILGVISGSILGPETFYTNRCFRGFAQLLQESARIVLQIGPEPLPPLYFLFSDYLYSHH
jgi:hypothetical protein